MSTPVLIATTAAAAAPPAPPSPTSSAPPVKAAELPKSVIFATSGIGGCMGWAIVHPANTLAVRTNLASMQGKKFNFAAMVKEHGIMSLYDGLGAGLWRQVFYASARFGLFETFRDKLHEIRGKTDFASRCVHLLFLLMMVLFGSCFPSLLYLWHKNCWLKTRKRNLDKVFAHIYLFCCLLLSFFLFFFKTHNHPYFHHVFACGCIIIIIFFARPIDP